MIFFSASVPHVLVITRSYLYIDRWFTARGTKAQVSFTDPSVILAVLWPHFHWKNHDQDQEIIKPTRAEWFRRGRYPKVWYFGLTQRILAEQTRVRQNQLSSCKVGKFFFFREVPFFVGQMFWNICDVFAWLLYFWCARISEEYDGQGPRRSQTRSYKQDLIVSAAPVNGHRGPIWCTKSGDAKMAILVQGSLVHLDTCPIRVLANCAIQQDHMNHSF